MCARLQNGNYLFIYLCKHLSHEKKLLNFYSFFLEMVVSYLARSPVMAREMSIHLPDLHRDVSSLFEGMTVFTRLAHSSHDITA